MRYLLDEALEQGAWGYSTGLEYAAERGADEDELVSMCEVCGRRHGIYATHTRQPRRGRRRGRRGGAPHGASAPACGCRSRTSSRATGSTRRGAASSSSTPRPAAGWTSRSTCTRGSTGRRSCSRRCRRGRSRIPRGCARSSAASEQRRAMRDYVSILSAGGDWSRIVLLDNDVWPRLRAARHRRDRRRARPGAARRGLRPPARRGRRSRAA